MENKKIVIPNIECLTDEQYKELTEFLDSCPVEYQEWEAKI